MSPTTRDLLVRGARQHGDRVAVVFGDEQLTFREVDELGNRLAHALLGLGAGRGSRVALLAGNGLLSAPLDFACMKTSVNRVPLNPRLSVAEHVRMVTETGCDLLLHGPGLDEHTAALARRLPGVRFVPVATELVALAQGAPATLPEVRVAPDDVILSLFTSGTTGTLKAAQHTQASFAAVARNVLLNLFPATPEDGMLHAASLNHASGAYLLPLWLRGARSIVLPGFVPGEFLAAIARYRPTAVNVVPTMLQALLDHPDFATADVSSLRRVIYGASPMPRRTIQRAVAAWGRERFWQFYGQTEVPLCIAVLRPEDHVEGRLGSCGQVAADVDLRLVDADGDDVAPGEPGEVVVRGPSAAIGYLDAPELTAAGFRDGWVHTRDVGVLDEDGFLHLRDRTSDMIISGGYNVYPREVEDALLDHPAVREAAVVGTPDEHWVEAVTAVVVVAPGVAADDDLRAELVAHVAERIASYKKPRVVHFRDAIPKTTIGKLDRRALRAQLGV
ncbi:class I adenylate-forming enzyme family protein [Actinokineospora bangkokensis]|uniref:Long-chain fatty acid--CoA ligase n=1 Tax=Actinokineospora bangkokensis TaxID=1193682 RepID=A0A1Q9LMX0_9PSEU|nr:AMP-binding protein [Actinokineospora bangkokensis]OLR93361.1 long-chain fatty acid--CoA ligase [Actinokineospora bangkokensis]